MTVKELIDELQKLDQDSGIWIEFDRNYIIAPLPDRRADAFDVRQYANRGMKRKDYIIFAG